MYDTTKSNLQIIIEADEQAYIDSGEEYEYEAYRFPQLQEDLAESYASCFEIDRASLEYEERIRASLVIENKFSK